MLDISPLATPILSNSKKRSTKDEDGEEEKIYSEEDAETLYNNSDGTWDYSGSNMA